MSTFRNTKFWLAEPKLFPYKYPNILYPVILRTYPPMNMEQTECSERWHIKFRHWGITQKKTYNISLVVYVYARVYKLSKNLGALGARRWHEASFV